MIYSTKKNGDKVGMLSMTADGLRKRSPLNLSGYLNNGVERCKRDGARSFVLVVEIPENAND